jgi:hypothetical protein
MMLSFSSEYAYLAISVRLFFDPFLSVVLDSKLMKNGNLVPPGHLRRFFVETPICL